MAAIDGKSWIGNFSLNQTMERFLPEPKSRLGFNLKSILGGVGSLVSQGVSSFTGIDPGYQELLNKQIEVQQQMQLVSLYSNIEKSKHETHMAAVRNVRVG